MQLKVMHPLYGGMGLAKDERVYFVKGAIPDETVEVRILDKKKDYSIADTVLVMEASPHRKSPPCPVFGRCGGCHYQYIEYGKQVSIKEEILCDCLRRIGKFQEINFEEAVSGNPFHYRRRARFKTNNGKIGFYRENSHEIVEFDECLLLNPELNAAYGKLKRTDIPPEVKEITLTAGGGIIAHILGADIDNGFINLLIDNKIVQGIMTDTGEIIGDGYTELPLGNLRFTVSPKSFLQSNRDINEQISEILLRHIKDPDTDYRANESGPEGEKSTKGVNDKKRGKLLDVFGGAGNFSLLAESLFDEIVVVEENKYSVEDGRRNAEINGINNIRFIESTFEEAVLRGKYNIVIVDPPRIGLTDKSIKKLLKTAPETIFYISCNPATLSRDAGKLRDMYTLNSVRLVDMFPQTYHCEVFCHFSIK